MKRRLFFLVCRLETLIIWGVVAGTALFIWYVFQELLRQSFR